MKTNFYSPFKLLAVLGMLSVAYTSYGQDALTDNHTITITIPSVAILDLEPSASKNITATFIAPAEAGDPLAAPANNGTLWLNYSTIKSGTTNRNVTAQYAVTSGTYSGLEVALETGVSATGEGELGTPVAGPVTLTTGPQPIVTGIGSAYTETGINYGHQLTYSFKTIVANYADLRVGETVLTITYTMTDV